MRLARRLAIVVVVLVAWEAVRRFGLVSAVVLASPSDIVKAFLQSGPEFLSAFWLTLQEIALAVAITWTTGLAVGLVVGSTAYATAVVAPLLSAVFAIPLITWYPLLVIWFGIGATSKIIYAVISGFFPVALATLHAVRQIDVRYVTFARSIGCTTPTILLRVLFPLAVPSIISGLRIGTALNVIGVIVTEMLASLGGLGFWISYNRTIYNTGHVYLGIVLSLLCVAFVNILLSRIERRYGMWRVEASARGMAAEESAAGRAGAAASP